MLQVPLAEWGGINAHDRIFHEGLSADQLVVSRVIDNIKDTSLLADRFGSPREGTRVDAECFGLEVTTASLNNLNALGTELGASGLATHFEETLLLVDWHAATRGSSFMPRVPRNTHAS